MPHTETFLVMLDGRGPCFHVSKIASSDCKMRTGLVTHLAHNELASILIFDHVLIIR